MYPKAVDKIVERWGRPDDWGRGQVAALVLLARHPDWALADIWPDETDPAAAVAHGLRILLSVSSESSDLPIIRDMLQDAVRQDVREYCYWFDLPPDWVAGYLLIRALAEDLKLQNPAVQIAGLQVLPLEMPSGKLEALSVAVIGAMQANAKAWRLVEKRAEDFITPKRSEKLAILIPTDTTGKVIGAMASPVMLFLYLQQRLLSFFAKPMKDDLSWTSELASHPVLKADFGEMAHAGASAWLRREWPSAFLALRLGWRQRSQCFRMRTPYWIGTSAQNIIGWSWKQIAPCRI